jgi:hypothetical protein
MLEALGLLKLSTELSKSQHQSATKKGKTSSEGSDTSEYLLENDDDQGDTDDDETESDAQPQPIEVLLLSSEYWMGNICIAFGCFKSVLEYMPLHFRYMFFLSYQFINICSCLLMHMI